MCACMYIHVCVCVCVCVCVVIILIMFVLCHSAIMVINHDSIHDYSIPEPCVYFLESVRKK